MFRSVRQKIRTFFKNREKEKQAALKAQAKAEAKARALAQQKEERRKNLISLIQSSSPLRVVVGASGIFPPGWVPTDIEDLNLLLDSDWRGLFQDNSIQTILAEHVWEHLTADQGLTAAKFCHRHLQPGGRLRIAIPDGLHPDPDYIEHVRVGGTGPGADDHKVLHTFKTLSAMFTAAGFRPVLLEYWDENGQFQFTEWNPDDGMIRRSKRFDQRNADGVLRYTSLIIDGIKE